MQSTVFLAGAAGAIGRILGPQLVAEGWRVVGTTRSPEKAGRLRSLGVEPVVVDVFHAAALKRLVVAAGPQIVVHQLTDLPPGLDPNAMEAARMRNARIRDEGTRNLVAAAVATGTRRFIAQSVAFAYADGPKPHREADPLATSAPGGAGISARGVASLEAQVLAGPFEGLVLRYGHLYGPGTGFDRPQGPMPLHVAAAADAARLALTRGKPGVYNIAEDDGEVDIGKARSELGWDPGTRHQTDNKAKEI